MDWGALLGGALGGLFGYKGTQTQNVASADQAEKAMAFTKAAQLRQMQFQERMSGSAHQRQIADMRKAGLNPILSAKYGGASSPAGSSAAGVAAPMHNTAAVALQHASQAANIQNIMANTAKTLAQTSAIGPQAAFGLGGQTQAAGAFSSAKDMLRQFGGVNKTGFLQGIKPSGLFINAAAAVLNQMNIKGTEKIYQPPKKSKSKLEFSKILQNVKSRLNRRINTKRKN